MTPEERFWLGVGRQGQDECWPAIGTTQVLWDGRAQQKRRIAWVLERGKIQKGKLILGTCQNLACCNPNHSILGTRKTLGMLKVMAGRSTKGERNSKAKITADDVRELRRLHFEDGWTATRLSEKYGVGRGTCVNIWNRKLWAHVE